MIAPVPRPVLCPRRRSPFQQDEPCLLQLYLGFHVRPARLQAALLAEAPQKQLLLMHGVPALHHEEAFVREGGCFFVPLGAPVRGENGGGPHR